MFQRIILKKVSHPIEKRPDKELDWIIDSLGLISGRDIHHITRKIISQLLEETYQHGYTNVNKLSFKILENPQKINYHLRTLSETGFLYRKGHTILLREKTLEETLKEMKQDAINIFDKLIEIAREIDKQKIKELCD